MKRVLMTNKEVNLAIIQKLKEFIVDNPDQRFCQILRNIGIFDTVGAVLPQDINNNLGFVKVFFSDEFYTESIDTLNKIKDNE